MDWFRYAWDNVVGTFAYMTNGVDVATIFFNSTSSFILSISAVVGAVTTLFGAIAALHGGRPSVHSAELQREAPADQAANPGSQLQLRLADLQRIADRLRRKWKAYRRATNAFAAAVIAAAIYFAAPIIVSFGVENVPYPTLFSTAAIGALVCLCWLAEHRISTSWLARAGGDPGHWNYWLAAIYLWLIPAIVIAATLYISAPAIRALSASPPAVPPAAAIFNAAIALAVALCWLLERLLRPAARAAACRTRLEKHGRVKQEVQSALREYEANPLHAPSLGTFADKASEAIDKVERAEAAGEF